MLPTAVLAFIPAQITCLQFGKADEFTIGVIFLQFHDSSWRAMGTWQAGQNTYVPTVVLKFTMAIEGHETDYL